MRQQEVCWKGALPLSCHYLVLSLSYCIASPSPLPSPVLLHSTIAETHTLQNRLAAAISLAINFSRNGHAGDKDDVDVASERHKEFCETLLHKASLFTATAYLILRNDDEPNYAKHEAGQVPPPRLPAGHKFRPFIWQDPILWLRITFTLHNYSKNEPKSSQTHPWKLPQKTKISHKPPRAHHPTPKRVWYKCIWPNPKTAKTKQN